MPLYHSIPKCLQCSLLIEKVHLRDTDLGEEPPALGEVLTPQWPLSQKPGASWPEKLQV